MRDPRRTSGWLTLAAVLAVTASQPTVLRSQGPAPRTFPDQRLVTPVNDLPGPYTRVHPWGELPYDPADYDARTAVIGAAEGPNGHIYVLTRCRQNSCAGRPEPPVLVFDAEGTRVGAWGAGLFAFPHHLTVDREGHVWTADEGTHAVRKFTADGRLLMTIGEPGTSGGPPRLLTSPTGVAVAPDGSVFVTEGHDNSPTAPVARVTKWTADGRFVKTWGRTGSAPGEFSAPHVIAMDSRGRVFVGDRNNNRIQIFDQEGTFLDLWYQFGRPSGIVITPDDRLYVVDSESFDFHNPGWEKGIRIGSAREGRVDHFIRDIEPMTISHSGAEGIGVDARGNIYGGVVRRRMLEKFVPNRGGAAPAAVPAPTTGATGPALTHFGHVATGFSGAPGGRGLTVTAAIEANEAMRHANLAFVHAGDLEQMRAHTRSVIHALSPGKGASGPGLGFGLTRAAEAIAAHVEMAVKAPDASPALARLGPGVATAARAVASRADALAVLGGRVLAAGSVAEARPLVDELRRLALALDTGVDADGSGGVELNATEPGLNQVEAQVYAILEAEKLPRVLR